MLPIDFLNKYLVTTWVNNEFNCLCLRHINRTTKNYLCSDVQRTTNDYRLPKKDRRSIFVKKWAKRFRIVNGELKRRSSRLDNNDSILKVEVLTDLKQLRSKLSFKELFETDLKTILPEDHECIERIQRSDDRLLKRYNVPKQKQYFLELHEDDVDNIKFASIKFQSFLKSFFKVDKVFYLLEGLFEPEQKSIFYQNSYLFQYIERPEKEVLSNSHKDSDITIRFWYFGDRVVWVREDGKGTW